VNDNGKLNTRAVLKNVRLAYVVLIQPKPYDVGEQPKYSCTLLLPPGHPGIEQIEAILEAAAIARWGKKSEWPKPLKGIHRDPVIKDCADYPKIGKLPPGWCFVRCSSLEPPGIVDANVAELNKADLHDELYSGRWATVSVNAFAYDRQTGKGVSLGLGNIQLLKHDTRLGAARPKPGEEFDPEDLPEADNDDLEPDAARPQRRR
jgi:hypothetical protein